MGNPCNKIFHLIKKACLALGFFFIAISGVYGQNQKFADSLELIYAKGDFREQDRLKILEELAVNSTDPKQKLAISVELIERALVLDSIDYLFIGYIYKKGMHLEIKANSAMRWKAILKRSKWPKKKYQIGN